MYLYECKALLAPYETLAFRTFLIHADDIQGARRELKRIADAEHKAVMKTRIKKVF